MSVDCRVYTAVRQALTGRCLAAACAAAAFGLPTIAPAGEWRLSDTVSADLTYVDRDGRNESSGAVLQLTPRLRLNGRGGRSQADIDYSLTASIGGGSTDPESLSHNLRGTGRVEVIDNMFFLGANASARLVGTSATSGTVDSINARSDGTQSYSFEITPEFRHHLNRYADIVSRNSVNYVTYGGNNRRSDDDSREVRTNIGVRSGRYFSRFNWNVDATRSETSFEDRDDERSNLSAGVGYRVDSHWRVRGTVGYEDNDVQTARDDTDGATWDAGVDWTPNPRTSVAVTYGERYLGNVFSGNASHRTRRTRLSLDFTRDVTNRRSSQLLDSFFFLVDANTGNPIIDPNTGDPILVNIPELEQIDEDFLNTQVRGAVTVTGRRTTATLTATVSQRDYEVTDQDEDSLGLSLRLSRQLGGGYRASVNSRYTTTDGARDGDSDSYDVSMSLSKQLSPRTRASVNVLHREQDESAGDDYTENRIGVSLISSFL